ALPEPDDFEGPTPGWGADGGVWEVGIPVTGPNAAHSGDRCAATVLDANYPDNVSSRLISPEFVVPGVDQNPRLKFWHWFAFNAGDTGRVQVKESDGDWVTVSSVYFSSGGGVWTQGAIDLRAYAAKTVQVGFLIQTAG